jgi:peptidoglycan/LPS O-acetylase OafA/YrhL
VKTETTPLIRLDTPRFRYKPALDGMRGIGVLIVMFYHYGGNIWLHGGPILIDLFFVLSAFLITNLLLDEVHKDGAINIRGFYYRRALRLFPAMYALLIVVGLLALIVAVTGSEEIPRSVWAEIAAVALYVCCTCGPCPWRSGSTSPGPSPSSGACGGSGTSGG